MKIKLSLFFALAVLVAFLTPRAAHADLGWYSATLVGTWKHAESGMVYTFKSDATYTFTNPKPGDSRIVAQSGWWKIATPTEKESGGSPEGPVALITKMRKVTFLEEHGLRHTKSLVLDTRSVLDFLGADMEKKPDISLIDSMKWTRVK